MSKISIVWLLLVAGFASPVTAGASGDAMDLVQRVVHGDEGRNETNLLTNNITAATGKAATEKKADSEGKFILTIPGIAAPEIKAEDSAAEEMQAEKRARGATDEIAQGVVNEDAALMQLGNNTTALFATNASNLLTNDSTAAAAKAATEKKDDSEGKLTLTIPGIAAPEIKAEDSAAEEMQAEKRARGATDEIAQGVVNEDAALIQLGNNTTVLFAGNSTGYNATVLAADATQNEVRGTLTLSIPGIAAPEIKAEDSEAAEKQAEQRARGATDEIAEGVAQADA